MRTAASGHCRICLNARAVSAARLWFFSVCCAATAARLVAREMPVKEDLEMVLVDLHGTLCSKCGWRCFMYLNISCARRSQRHQRNFGAIEQMLSVSRGSGLRSADLMLTPCIDLSDVRSCAVQTELEKGVHQLLGPINKQIVHEVMC